MIDNSIARQAMWNNQLKANRHPIVSLASGYTARWLLFPQPSVTAQQTTTKPIAEAAGKAPPVQSTAANPTLSSATAAANSSSTATASANNNATTTTTGPPRPSLAMVKALTNEEIDKDLRHFNAYRSAVISYRQQYYAAVNQIPLESVQRNVAHGVPPPHHLPPHHHPVVASTLPSTLPVRIDPEEEKRLESLRKKITRAECIREELEQRYVALRAHYVQEQQLLQQTTKHRIETIQTWQDALEARSKAVGLLRARLQMTRDVLHVLRRREQAIVQYNADHSLSGGVAINNKTTAEPAVAKSSMNGTGEPMSAAVTDTELTGVGSGATVETTANSTAAKNDKGADQVFDVWNRLEEDLKKCTSIKPTGKKPMLLRNSKLPETPFDVPLLLSNISSVPEKTVAYSVNGIFGSHPESLCWTDQDIDVDVPDDADAAGGVGDGSNSLLKEKVEFLKAELRKERKLTQEFYGKITQQRVREDEWVAMLCLLRQETDSVLHRHNILLESDIGKMASQKLYDEELQQHEHAMANTPGYTGQGGDTGAAEDGSLTQDGTSAGGNDAAGKATAPASPEDKANDGDDEGSAGDDASQNQQQDWNANQESSNKRTAGDLSRGSSPSPSKTSKRRRT